MQNAGVSIAMVGCGCWGKNLVRNFHAIGNLAAICDSNKDIAQSMEQQFAKPAMTWDDILLDINIDAVGLAVPAEMHAEFAFQALDAGKHVFVEKPLALKIKDAQNLVERARASDLVLMVGHLLQYHPVFVKMKKMVDGGEIGTVGYIYSNRLSLGKIRREENVLWSFAPHDISMVLALAGCEPTSVSASGSAIIDTNIEDVVIAQLLFPNGIGAHIFSSWVHPFKEQRLVVTGDKGMLVFEDHKPWDQKLGYYPHTFEVGAFATLPNKEECQFILVDQGEPLKNECQHFVDCIEKGFKPTSDGVEGLAVLRVLEAASRAMK